LAQYSRWNDEEILRNVFHLQSFLVNFNVHVELNNWFQIFVFT